MESNRKTNFPFGFVLTRIKVTVETLPDCRLEEEEIMIDEEEHDRPTFNKPVKVAGGYESEPENG